MYSWNKNILKSLGYQSNLSSLAVWKLESLLNQCELWSFNRHLSNSCSLPTLMASLAMPLSILKKILENLCAYFCNSSHLRFCPFLYSAHKTTLHQFPNDFNLYLLDSAKPPCSAWAPLLSFGTESISREKARMLIGFILFLPLRDHSTVLRTVISCMLSSFLVVYNARGESLLTWKCFQHGCRGKRSHGTLNWCKSFMNVKMTWLEF